MKYVQASSESAGATLAQQAKYTESMQYSLEKLNNAWEALIKGMSSSEFFITVVDALTELLKVLENISPLILPIGGALAALFGAGNNITSGFITVITALLNGNTGSFNESVLGKGLKNWIELFNAIKKHSNKLKDFIAQMPALAAGELAAGVAGAEGAIGVTSFGAAFKAALPELAAVAVILTALILIINKLNNPTKKAKENIKNLYAEIYNRQENVDNVKDLVEQYKELDKQVVKTADDYEELASLQQQIIEATENPNLFTVSGGIDDEVYQKWLDEQKQAQIDSTLEEYKNIQKLGGLSDAYYGDDADSYTKAAALNIETMKQLTGEYTDATAAIKKYYENLETYSLEEKQLAEDNAKQAMALEQKYQIKTGTTKTWTKDSTITDVNEQQKVMQHGINGVDWEWDQGSDGTGAIIIKKNIKYEVTEEKSIAEVIAEKIEGTDPTAVIDALNKWMNDDELTATDKQVKNYVMGLDFTELEGEFGTTGTTNFLQYLSTMNEEYAAAVAVWRTKNGEFEKALNDAREIINGLGDDISLEKINQFLNLVDIGNGEGQVSYDTYANAISDVYKQISDEATEAAWSSEDFINTLTEGGVKLTDVADVLETILNDVMDMDWSSTITGVNATISSINSINDALAEGDISSVYKDLYALMQEYPQYANQIVDSIINQGEISSEVVEGMASNAQALALTQMETDKAVAEEKAAQYRQEAENLAIMSDETYEQHLADARAELGVENLTQEQINKIIDSRVQAETQASEIILKQQKQIAEARMKAEAGDNNIDTTAYSEKVVEIYQGTFDESKVSNSRAEAIRYAVQQAENYTNQAKAIQALIDGVKNNKLNLFKGISKSSGSSATDEVKEYAAQLTELYNIERKIAGLDTRKNLIDSLADYYEELGDGAAQRAATKKGIELLKEQTKYYEQQIEVAEKMANTLLKSMSKQAASIVYVDKETQQLMIDYNKYSNATDEVKEEIDDLVDEYQELIEKADEGTEALLNYQLELEKYMNNIRDKTIEYQNELKDAFIKYYQDIYQAQIDALEKESELLDERKELYQDAFDEEDYNDELKELSNNRETIIKKLAKLEGASDSKSKAERTSLLEQLEEANKSYNDKVTEYNRDALLEQIDQEKDGIEERVALLEELMDDIPNKVEMLEAAITELTNSGLDNVIRFLQQWSDEWSTALSTERQQIEEEWTSMYEYLYGDEAQNSFTTYYDNLLKKAKDTYAAIAAAASNAANSGSSSSSSKSSGNTYTGSSGGDNDEDEPSTNVKNNWQLNQNQQYFDTEKSKTSTKGRGTVGGGAYDALTGDKIAASNTIKTNYSSSTAISSEYTLLDKLKKYGTNTKWYSNAKGGLIDFTGPTWVDGTKSNPEAFLNAHQTAMFENLTASLEKMYNNNSDIANGSPITIENVTVNTNQLNNGQDWYASGGKLAQGLQDTLRKRGIVTNINQ